MPEFVKRCFCQQWSPNNTTLLCALAVSAWPATAKAKCRLSALQCANLFILPSEFSNPEKPLTRIMKFYLNPPLDFQDGISLTVGLMPRDQQPQYPLQRAESRMRKSRTFVPVGPVVMTSSSAAKKEK